MIVNTSRAHSIAKPTDSVRTWHAPGGVRVTAVRIGGEWTITEGPNNLVGRNYPNIATARHAVRQS